MDRRRVLARVQRKLQRYRGAAAVVFVAAAFGALSALGYGGISASATYGYGYGYGYNYEYNSPPTCTPASNQSSDEGENHSFSLGSFGDVDGNGPWQVVVHWGDTSSTSFSQSSTGALPPKNHIYADNGTYTVDVAITDADSASTTCTFHVTVGNLPPTCGPITAPVSPVPINTLVTATAPFTDPGVLDTHTASMNWGDATTSAGTVTEVNGSGNVSATHTYTAPGVYTLTLTVTDKDGASGTCTYQFVTVFNPNDGFVTGGGWINSPPGAYTANPSLTGKATFGFVAKYLHGSSTPSGNTEFQFKAGNLNFNSSSYDFGTLVIAGAKAMYKGSGTINGAGDYAFRVWAIDGKITGGGGVDKFRIKIWNKNTNAVVYDNQMGGADNANPTTALAGGSITIHK